VPAAIAGVGDTAVRRFLEFFAATIRNENTRTAYYRAVTDFFAWFYVAGIAALVDIEPLHVATYIEALQGTPGFARITPGLLQIRCDARRPEGVIADQGIYAGVSGAPADHGVGVGLGRGVVVSWPVVRPTVRNRNALGSTAIPLPSR
jgi:hypothetical protein